MTRPTVLLLDTDPSRAEDVRRPLLQAGFRVETVHDGVAGLEAFERRGHDLVVIEPMLPRRNGFDVCREIKRAAAGHRTPVVIVTSFYAAREYEAQAAREYGCDAYFEKPVPASLLIETCRRLLGTLRPSRLAPPEAAEAVVELSAASRVRAGSLYLLLDGAKVYSRRLAGERGGLRRLLGGWSGVAAETFGVRVEGVRPGRHRVVARATIEGRILGSSLTLEIAGGAVVFLRLEIDRREVRLEPSAEPAAPTSGVYDGNRDAALPATS